MAEFSKQYCELNNMGFDGDFDIMEELEELEDGHYMSLICEGFGFCLIAKDAYGKCMLGFENKDAEIDWIHYDEYLENYQIKDRINEK